MEETRPRVRLRMKPRRIRVAPVETALPPVIGKIPAKRNRTRIALVAVSIVAILLLASTITLAVLGDFGGHHFPEAKLPVASATSLSAPCRARAIVDSNRRVP